MQLKTVSSQYKHLPERGENDFAPYLTGSEIMLKNDTFSFQALCRADDGCVCLPVSVSAVCGGVPGRGVEGRLRAGHTRRERLRRKRL